MSCTVAGCDSPVLARGYCNRHYLRNRRHGHPEASAPPPDHRALFLAKTQPQPDGCVLWNGARTSSGYGVLTVKRANVLAHRYALTLAGVEIPGGYHVDHLCRVRLCVNPDHLEPVTQQENNRRAAQHRHARRLVGAAAVLVAR